MNVWSKAILTTAALGMMSGLAAQASAGGVTEVTASQPGEAVQVVVEVADLNLHSSAGQEVLAARISQAAEEICGSSNPRVAGGVSMAARNKECQRDTVDRALSRALSEVSRSAVATAS